MHTEQQTSRCPLSNQQLATRDPKVRILARSKKGGPLMSELDEREIDGPFWMADSEAFEEMIAAPLKDLGFNLSPHMIEFSGRFRSETAFFFLGDLREQLTPQQAAIFGNVVQDQELLSALFSAPGRGTA
jgi:hypothetical protein